MTGTRHRTAEVVGISSGALLAKKDLCKSFFILHIGCLKILKQIELNKNEQIRGDE